MAKTYVELLEDEPTCSTYVGRFVGSSGQPESDGEDTTTTKAYAVSGNDENDSVSIPD